MTPENIATLEKHRHFHDTLINAFYIKGLNHMEKDDLLRIYREEWAPNANPDLWCSECIADFVKDVYRKFDEYLAKQTKHIEVAASFPKHKRK